MSRKELSRAKSCRRSRQVSGLRPMADRTAPRCIPSAYLVGSAGLWVEQGMRGRQGRTEVTGVKVARRARTVAGNRGTGHEDQWSHESISAGATLCSRRRSATSILIEDAATEISQKWNSAIRSGGSAGNDPNNRAAFLYLDRAFYARIAAGCDHSPTRQAHRRPPTIPLVCEFNILMLGASQGQSRRPRCS